MPLARLADIVDLDEFKRQQEEFNALPPDERKRILAKIREEQKADAAAHLKIGLAQSNRLDLPPIFEGATLDNLREKPDSHGLYITKNNYDAISGARAWIAGLDSNVTLGRGQMFIGPTGVGKTHIVAAAARAFFEKYPTKKVEYINWTVYVHESQIDKAKRETYALASRLKRADLLILDEIGGAKETYWSEDVLYSVLDHFWTHKKLLLATTNLQITPPKDKPDDPSPMAAQIGDRPASRLKGLTKGEIYQIGGKSYR